MSLFLTYCIGKNILLQYKLNICHLIRLILYKYLHIYEIVRKNL